MSGWLGTSWKRVVVMSDFDLKVLIEDRYYWRSRAEQAEARVKELEDLLQLCYITIGNDKDSQLQVVDQ